MLSKTGDAARLAVMASRWSEAGEDRSVAVVAHVDGIAWTVCSSLCRTGDAARLAVMASRWSKAGDATRLAVMAPRRSKAGEDRSVAVVARVDVIAWTVCSSLCKTGEVTRLAVMAPRRSPLTLPLDSSVRHRPAVARTTATFPGWPRTRRRIAVRGVGTRISAICVLQT
ncbi:hypothetical protein [Actinoplanes sp. NPDC049802]|uniref:hypothetical protein n=1 Tax=Actinoplanes sp. NPDC049802 TaxID=3154742 RepID=UPI0033E880AD